MVTLAPQSSRIGGRHLSAPEPDAPVPALTLRPCRPDLDSDRSMPCSCRPDPLCSTPYGTLCRATAPPCCRSPPTCRDPRWTRPSPPCGPPTSSLPTAYGGNRAVCPPT